MSPLLGEPAPDFGDPLGLLAACHGRMRGFCNLLERLPDWVDAQGVDAEAVAGMQRTLNYFDLAAPLHPADEEEDLFPLLAADAACAQLIDRLRSEHRQLEQHWHTLATLLRGLQSGARVDGARLRDATTTFCSACRDHIAVEDERLLPAAHARLQAPQLAAMSEHMARRRRPADAQ